MATIKVEIVEPLGVSTIATDTEAEAQSREQNSEESKVSVDGEETTLSRRAQRREKRKALMEHVKLRKKQLRQERQREKGNTNGNELDMSDEAVLRRREKTLAKKESFLMACEEGFNVVIDCGFEQDMRDREKKSLSQQIMFCYGVNKRSQVPAKVRVTSLTGETLQNLERIAGFHDWLAFKSSPKCYMDLYAKESLVYLTADSPNTITHLSRDKVYIIGGIVDRNRLKGVTYQKAVEQGIATAKLPLDKCVYMGTSTRVLTVNHVFEILVRFFGAKDWTQAVIKTLPNRKNVQQKDQDDDDATVQQMQAQLQELDEWHDDGDQASQ